MKFSVLISGLIAATIGLSGCVGGTTYGTGVSQGQETLEGVFNMFSLGGKKKKKIDYSARADLVIPSDKSALSEPVSVESSTSNPDWPESPQQKIARVRGEVTEADVRSGEIPLAEMRREKQGIRATKGNRKDVSRAASLDGDDTMEVMFSNQSKKVKKRKAELAYSTTPKRKFLTEPPETYRTPANTAAAGDLGIDEAKALEQEKQEKERVKERTR
ncbi:MAG: hypothetical protein JKX91_13505 [Rhizobiaceae bacterium]|nr:hypothetical protein [Rhizobiaceae bacterium]